MIDVVSIAVELYIGPLALLLKKDVVRGEASCLSGTTLEAAALGRPLQSHTQPLHQIITDAFTILTDQILSGL